MTTILDVATRAGVGVGTVSRVLNDSPAVSDATRARVLQAIDELAYRPSSSARALSSGKTSAIFVLGPFLTRSSMFDRLRGVVDALASTDHELILRNLDFDTNVAEYCQTIDRPSGFVLITIETEPEFVRELLADDVSIVTVDVRVPGVPSVYVDDIAAGEIACRHLVEQGHRSIAYIGDADNGDYRARSSRDRLIGVKNVLEEFGLDLSPDHERLVPHSRAEAAWAAEDLVRLPDPPTAVVCASDDHALGAIEGAGNRGVKVPDDLSVVGADDIDSSRYAGLTTVRQPLYESGLKAGELMLRELSGRKIEETDFMLPLRLIERSSTKPPLRT